jgi:tetratricopeptide (TPR) repeat protein
MKALLGIAALLALGAIVGFFFFIKGRHDPLAQLAQESVDPRLSIQSPFLNTKPDVRYVGDAKCAECHDSITQKFNKHPMHLTLAEASAKSMPDSFKPEALKPFQFDSLTYTVEQRGDKIVHRQSLRESDGSLRTTFETDVNYTIGSGALGFSFLYQRDGRVMQSPISWYSQRQEWGLSPGYENSSAGFQRPIGGECFNCHGNYAEIRPNTLNHFQLPLASRGYGIGCERCHGPGELHVKYEQEGGLDLAQGTKTIVNPKDNLMAGHLREAVCEQCHLEGVHRVLRRGRDFYDYRPGLPLYSFWSVFVNSNESGEYQAVGQVEQMHESRCYKSSQGSLSCTSCHDPHEVPESKNRVTFFRDRCLQCHAQKGCSVPESIRREKEKEDSCIACHMPRVTSKDIVHAAITNHRVPRKAPESSPDQKSRIARITRNPLMHFHSGQVNDADPDLDRDLGIALANLSAKPLVKDHAMSLLEKATQAHPDDLQAWLSLAEVYGIQDRHAKALETYEKALSLVMDCEIALMGAGGAAAANGNPDQALDYMQRASAVNPYNSYYHCSQARFYAQQKKWEQAAQEARTALDLDFSSFSVHQILIEALVHLGRDAEAERERVTLETIKPQQAKQIREWFRNLNK